MILNRFSFLNKKSEESQVIFIYRYISLVITSAFYFSNQVEHGLQKKIFIIACISISAVILSYLYLKFENSYKNIIILLVIETIGNSVLLIPSGGLYSAFIWYSLNTILISAILLNVIYSWINFSMYLLSIYIINYLFTGIDFHILNIIKDDSNFLLSFTMIIVAIQAWSIFIKNTKKKNTALEVLNGQLESANQKIIQSMDHIKELYQTVNILSSQGNKEGLLNVLFENIKNITKSDTIFYYDISEETNKMILDGDVNLLEALEENINEDLINIIELKEAEEINILGSRFILVTVKISHLVYGILGIKVSSNKESIAYKNKIYQLQFLSELISVVFERLSLEEIHDRLLITEEQNRIANEIHDGVLQKLFCMSCGVFSLMKSIDEHSKEDIEKELNAFRNTTDSTMKELREKIYGLSWKKTGYNSFSIDVRRYIEDIKKMNGVNIPFIINGSDELLSYDQKKALYRMICEGVGNSFRHGNANNIDVNLDIDSHRTILRIIDDGIGFDLEKARNNKKKGMGLENLYQLTGCLHGEIRIDTKPGRGSSIEIILPNNIDTRKGAEAV